jgi:2-succinyl-5-enolpyruvyl-6-hydroxy-3-cyclohexene-1-carboxylate synthase
VAAYDVLLEDPEAAGLPEPDLVLRVGPGPTSAAVRRYLADRPSLPQVVVDAGGRWMDHAAVASEYLPAEPGPACHALAGELEREPPERDGWPDPWRDAGRRAAGAVRRAVDGPFFEGSVLHHVAAGLPEGATLVVGSSMPVRDLDAFGLPREADLRVLGNRGASGIDGLVSTALGASAGRPGPLAVVCGDLSLIHDMNGLLAARDHDGDVTLVVINNDGGGIFHFLPIREFDPPFDDLFATPHGLDFSRVAGLHDLPYRRIGEEDDLRSALSEVGRQGGGVRLVEVESHRERNRRRRREATSRILEAAAAGG